MNKYFSIINTDFHTNSKIDVSIGFSIGFNLDFNTEFRIPLFLYSSIQQGKAEVAAN